MTNQTAARRCFGAGDQAIVAITPTYAATNAHYVFQLDVQMDYIIGQWHHMGVLKELVDNNKGNKKIGPTKKEMSHKQKVKQAVAISLQKAGRSKK
jgi:hypothetical protein